MTEEEVDNLTVKIALGAILSSVLVVIFSNPLSTFMGFLPFLVAFGFLPFCLLIPFVIPRSARKWANLGYSILSSLAVVGFALNYFADFSEPVLYPGKIVHHNRYTRGPSALLGNLYLPGGRVESFSLTGSDVDEPVQVGDWGQVRVHRGLFGLPHRKGFILGPGPNDHLRPKEAQGK